MELPEDDLRLVTLGHVDVDPRVLTGDGGPLREAIGSRPVDDRIGDHAPALPAAGWRLIHRTAARGEWGGSEHFAAPRADGGWATATVSVPLDGGDAILSADPGPVLVLPGCAARRAGLTLSWPANLTAPAGSVPEISVELRNTTDRVWTNGRDESAHVRAWLLDPDGHRYEESSWFAHGGAHGLPTLPPGEVVVLPVDLASFDYQSLRPGRYRLDAVVVALDLRAAAGSLTLV